MVAYHDKYVAQGTVAQSSDTFGTANTIASAVLDRFKLGSLKPYRHFLSEGDVFDRGEEVDIHDFLHLLDPNRS